MSGAPLFVVHAILPIRKLKQALLLLTVILTLWVCVFTLHRVGLENGYVQQAYKPVKSIEQLETEQQERKQLLGRVCDMMGQKRGSVNLTEQKDFLSHVIVDDQHHVLYCYVPKVACTNWKRLLMVAMGKSNSSNPLDIIPDDAHRQHVFLRLSNYTSSGIDFRLKHYTKFVFVRHPFERLVSAYRNKFYQNYTSSEYFRSRYGKYIVNTYRANASNESLTRGHDVTFSEFVQYLIDPRTIQRGPFNEHWRSTYDLCQPCQVPYDVVGKYETLQDDTWLVLHKTKLSELVSFPRTDKPSETPSLVETYMGSLDRDQLLRLYNLYEADFRLFDYHYLGLE